MHSLRLDLIALYMERSQYDHALSLLQEQSQTMANGGWDEIAVHLREQIMICYYNLKQWDPYEFFFSNAKKMKYLLFGLAY